MRAWLNWYGTKAWLDRRDDQLRKEPLCQPCKAVGRLVPATVAHHKIKHEGDRDLFFKGELESVCEHCHNRYEQQKETVGYSSQLDADGYPVDPNHPFNK